MIETLLKQRENYYVYMYLDLDNIPFYIGKGRDNRHCVRCHLSKTAFNRFLKNKINKVGRENVKIRFLHKNLTEKEALSWERYWIKKIGRRDLKEGSLCNLTDGGEGVSGSPAWNKGKKLSEETKRKIGDANRGEHSGWYGKSTWNAGKTFGSRSEVTKRRISASKMGYHHTEETKQKISKVNKGRKHTEEIKRKISETNKGKMVGPKNPAYGKPAWNRGKPMSEVAKCKLSAVNKGKRLSEETKLKMSEAAYRRWERERGNTS